MAENEILGISGQMDISDIQSSFEKMSSDLDKLGIKANEVSDRMTKALNDISQSASSDTDKTKQAIAVLQSGLADINKALANTPQVLKELEEQSKAVNGTIEKLSQQLSTLGKGSDNWAQVNEQLRNQQDLAAKLNSEYTSLQDTYVNAQQYAETLNISIEALNAGRTASTAATGASAVAHTTTAVAVGAEAAAHSENAAKISDETQQTEANTASKLRLTQASDNWVYTAQMEAEAVSKVAERLAAGKSDEEEYLASKKSAIQAREELVQKMEQEKQKMIEIQAVYAQSMEENGGKASPEIASQFNDANQTYYNNMKEYRSELDALNNSLEQLEISHRQASKAALEQSDGTQQLNQAAREAEIYFNGEIATVEGVTQAIELNKQELRQLQAEYKNIRAAYGADSQQAKENQAAQKEVNKNIAEGREVLKKLGTSYEEATQKVKEHTKATKDVGKAAKDNNNALGQIQKGIGDIKSGFKGGFGISTIMKGLTSPVGATLAAVGAVGATVKWVSEQNRMLDEALMGVKGYVDSGVLEQLRQQYVNLEYDSVQTAEQMAAAGTRWVKYFEGLRGSAAAIADVTEASNNFATVLGGTSEQAADYMLKIAGAYHQSADEAKQNAIILINASKNSTAKYEEMAQAISSSASRAAQGYATMKDFVAAVAYSSSQFQSASAAASTYTMMMQRLASSTKKEYNPSVVGASKALENLSKAKNVNATLTALLGKRQAQMAKIFVKNADAINNLKDKLDDEASAMKVVTAMGNKLENQEKRLENSKRALAHEMNANLTPAYATFLDYLAVTIKGLGNIGKEIKNALNPLVSWFNNLNKKFANSAIWQFLKKYAQSPLIRAHFGLGGLASIIHDWQEGKDNKKSSREADFGKTYDYYLKRYGKQSPGKAMEATARYMKNKGYNYTNKDEEYLLKRVEQTRAEANARTNGVDNEIGNQNAIDDKKKNKNNGNERKRAQKQLNDSLLKLQQKNQDEEIALLKDGTEKKLAQIRNEYAKRKEEINKQEKLFKENNKKAGVATNASGLTTDQNTALSKARQLATEKYKKEIDEARRDELQSMRDYLKKYGSLIQQRQAIEEDYDDKISRAKSDGERFALQEEKKAQLGSFEYDNISKGIDWKALLNGVSNLSLEMLKPMLSQLQAYTKTSDFTNASIETQEKTVELIKELKSYIGSDDNDTTRKDLIVAIETFNNAVKEYNDAVKIEKNLKQQQVQAKQDLADGKITQEEFDRIVKTAAEAAKVSVSAGKKMNDAGRDVNEKTDDLKNKTSKLTDLFAKDKIFGRLQGADSVKGVSQGMDTFVGILNTDVIPKMNEGLGKSTAEGLSKALPKISSGINDTMSSVFSSGIGQMIGMYAQIAQLIMSLANAIKEYVTGIINSFSEFLNFSWLNDLVNSILDAVSNLIDTIIDLPKNLWHVLSSIVVDGVGGLLNTVIGRLGNVFTGGVLSSAGPADWFTNSNAKQVAEKTEKLTKSNENLQKSVDNLKNELSKQSGWKAIDTARRAKEDQQQINEQTMDILRTQMAYHGAHSSNAYYWNLKAKDYDSINETLSRYKTKNPTQDTTLDRVNSLEDIYKLTPEQMDYIRTYNREQWKYITDAGKYDKSEYWENYADLAGQMEEIADSLKEALTGTTFDNMRNNFVNELMDMSKTAQDFSDSFSEMLMQSVLNAKISDIMDDELQDFYKKWAEYAESDNVLDEAEIAELKQEYQGYVKRGMELRDQAAAITGYDGTSAGQKTSSSSVGTITQDQANELNGRFTALQIAGELHNQYLLQNIDINNQIRDNLKEAQVDISTIKVTNLAISQNISELLDIQYDSVDKLSKIATYTSVLPAMNDNINNIYRSVKDINRK